MILWMKAKLTTIIIAAVAVLTAAGAGAAIAAQNHNAPASPGASAGAAQQANEFEAQGVIKQITFDQGSAHSGNLLFLPDGQQTTVKVIFTGATHIEIGRGNSGDSSHDQNDDAGAQPAGILRAGITARIEGVVQADGSVLARQINAHARDANDNDGDNNDGDDNDGQEDEHVLGVIQSVDLGAHTFVLLPDGQGAPVTIAFDAQTNIEDEGDGRDNAVLAVGAHVQVEVITRSDSSLYATEIKPASNHDGNNGGPGGGGNSGPGGGDDGGSGGHDGGGDNSGPGGGGGSDY